MADIRVLILAEDPLARAGLAAMFLSDDSIDVIGQANPASDLLEPFAHDVALFDLGWEVDADLDALAASAALDLNAPVLVLLPDGEFITQAVTQLNNAESLTAYGVLARNTPVETVVAALHALNSGLITLDPTLTPGLMPTTIPDPSLPPLTDTLTPRESEVLDLLAEGLPNKQIARRLTISEYTVKFHVNAILSKLGAASRTEAVVRATRLGLITL